MSDASVLPNGVSLKTLDEFEIKDADKGEVRAIISTYNMVDHDGDVVLPGAIKDGTVVKLSAYGHDVIIKGAPPVGKGTIRSEGNRAIFEGKYFMSTPRGRDAFNQVKEMGTDSQWSVGFLKQVKTRPMTNEWREKGATRLIAGMDAIEASPVFLGANAHTTTLGVKSADTETVDADVKALAEAIAEKIIEQRDMERKAALEAEAAEAAREAERIAAETKAAAAADAARKSAEVEAVSKEVERFRRTQASVT